MPLYQYKGLNSKGKPVSGILDADGPADLRQRLRREGIFLSTYAESGGGKSKTTIEKGGESFWSKEVNVRQLFERVKISDVAVLTRQFGTLLKAGIPMVESLNALIAQQERPKLKGAMIAVRQKVNEGSSLADALAEHKGIFSDLYINMVRVGEASGTLDIVLDRLAEILESQSKLRSKLIAAMIYPVLMVCVAFGIVSLMMLFVIPRVTELFEDMGTELPILTRILIFISKVFSNTWFIGLPLLIFGISWFRKWTRTEKGRIWFDNLKLRLPIFGQVFRLVAVARFARTLATLLTSGVPILVSLDIAKTIVNNVILARAIEDAKTAVREGESLAVPLEKSGHFPPMMTHMVAIGEKSGQLESMLGNVAQAYEVEVETRVTTLTAVLEPVMIVGMGMMVAFLVFAILMPMLKMNEAIVGQ